MKPSALLTTLAAVPSVAAWGSLGHITTAYIASTFVSNTTQAYLQDLLHSSNDDYLASVATWADSIRYTRWGRFTSNFHFIDAKDSPPHECNVDFDRDCKAGGCIITALANYTARAADPALPLMQRQDAAKFVVHFVGDLHQPLHNEDVQRGGNGIKVKFHNVNLNLHHVWDSTIAEKWIGVRGKPNGYALGWAQSLVTEIKEGKFAKEADSWLDGMDYTDPVKTALQWSRECNKLVCSHGKFSWWSRQFLCYNSTNPNPSICSPPRRCCCHRRPGALWRLLPSCCLGGGEAGGSGRLPHGCLAGPHCRRYSGQAGPERQSVDG